MPGIRAVTDADFDTEVLKADGPVLVDFWADWCPPCHLVAPILEEIDAEHVSRLTVRKLDIDDNPLTPARYEVLSVPTLIVYHNGEVVGRIVGAMPKAALLDELTTVIDSGGS